MFEEPIETDTLEFLIEHAECDCIAEYEDNNSKVSKVYAVATDPEYNQELREYFDKQRYKDTVHYIRAISLDEIATEE